MAVRKLLVVLGALCLVGCEFKQPAEVAIAENDQLVELTILQLNDVYEIAPVSSGTRGGMARVQTLLKQLKAENQHTYSVMAGDLYSPSVIGNAEVDGKRLAGKQMVDVMNAMNWDFFTIGNHEFDISEEDYRARLKEATFKNITDNVFDENGEHYENTIPAYTFEVDGVRIGIMGLTMTNFKHSFGQINDLIATATIVTQKLEASNTDIIIAITHQSISDDIALARAVSGIDLILGGHEHDNFELKRGDNETPITKADANAKSAFVHRLSFDKITKRLQQESELVLIDESIEMDVEIKKLVDGWLSKAFDYFKANGFTPEEVVCNIDVTLDGTDASVRSQSTGLTDLIAQGFIDAFPEQAEAGILNGGSIRMDDKLNPNGDASCPVTQYELMKISPFGGSVSLVQMQGDILIQALEQGLKNRGKGSFLQYAAIAKAKEGWTINEGSIDPKTFYTIAISSYLVDKGDQGLEFLAYGNSKGRVKKVEESKLVQFNDAVIQAFRHQFPG